jgi:hypothetical protein
MAEAIGEQSEVADAHEAFWQHMEKEAAQQLGGIESHAALLCAVGIVLVAEGDMFTVEVEQALIGGGHAMGVAAQVTQHLGRLSEGRLGIDNPLLYGAVARSWRSDGTRRRSSSSQANANSIDRSSATRDFPKHCSGRREAVLCDQVSGQEQDVIFDGTGQVIHS